MRGGGGMLRVAFLWTPAAAAALVLAAPPSTEVAAQIPPGKVVRLSGDTDEAVGLAKQVRHWIFTHPAAVTATLAGKVAIVQSWLEDRSLDQLSDKERFLLANPQAYERPIVTDVAVHLGPPVAVVVLAWDVPLRLWPRVRGEIRRAGEALGHELSRSLRRAIRLFMRLEGSETLRLLADDEGKVTLVFSYD
jgi:hypothetical protein